MTNPTESARASGQTKNDMNTNSNVEVRRHNGQCAYGPWYPADHEDIPSWVREYAETEQIEDQRDEGRVECGGSIWLWRTV